ncbi:MAG TPA: nucleotidyl transferase AbiEii/AbiGii toxin family protein [Solirubrobacteraceae bacterium]|nr:nucleotidyl transferase AbiEii/AbiGii toxin family protein [Solirubrobacteraceae bacterium]
MASHLPDGLYLAGGTAAAVRLHHRQSHDLDFFFHQNAVDLDALEQQLTALGAAVELRAPGTLRMYVGPTKVEFFHADQIAAQHRIAEPEDIGQIPVVDLRDLMAMKLKVLAERGELRDYYDVKEIEQRGGISIEEGISLFMFRFGLDRNSSQVRHLIVSLGYLEDCDEDLTVPMSKEALAAWWRQRQRSLLRNLGS